MKFYSSPGYVSSHLISKRQLRHFCVADHVYVHFSSFVLSFIFLCFRIFLVILIKNQFLSENYLVIAFCSTLLEMFWNLRKFWVSRISENYMKFKIFLIKHTRIKIVQEALGSEFVKSTRKKWLSLFFVKMLMIRLYLTIIIIWPKNFFFNFLRQSYYQFKFLSLL